MTGLVVLGVALVVTLALGLVHRSRDGRLRVHRSTATRETRTPDPSTSGNGGPQTTADAADLRPALVALGAAYGDRATLLQFSSAFCAPCRATRRTLAEIAAAVDGVRHVEVDAEEHLDLVRRLGILKTPTTLVLDADGHEVVRASGQPRKADVVAALGKAVAS